MKKFILKRDISLAKAGTIVTLEETPVKSSVRLIFSIKNTEYPLCTIDVNEINAWIEEIPEKPKSVLELKEGDNYYYISGNGLLLCGTYKGDWMFNKNLNNLNAFLTEEETRKEIKKRKAIAKIKKYCWENGIDTKYNNVTDSYVFNLNDLGKVIYCNDYKNGNPLGYFSKKNVEEIFDNFGEELQIILN